MGTKVGMCATILQGCLCLAKNKNGFLIFYIAHNLTNLAVQLLLLAMLASSALDGAFLT